MIVVLDEAGLDGAARSARDRRREKFMTNANLFDQLASSVVDPSKIAIETSAGRRISYGELNALSGRFANLLRARGVKPGAE